MSVLLHHGGDLPRPDAYTGWLTIGPAVGDFKPGGQVPNLPARLENAFDTAAPSWLELGRRLGSDASASLAHAPACAANISDMGLMMAWTLIVKEQAAAEDDCLVVCDDPWVFRHLANLPGVKAGSPPPLYFTALKLTLRGFLARAKCAFDLGRRNRALRGQQSTAPQGGDVLLVYGHPLSTAEGQDGYFGDLMKSLPDLRRVFHVDCPTGRALELAAGGRSVSLHGWGRLRDLAGLIFARWTPAKEFLSGENGWLVRRAAAREGGTAQGAMIAWQQKCQRRWLAETKPQSVAWPWENHSWERDFVRAARVGGVRTIGYQHSVIGHQMLNYAPGSNPDDLASIPDVILSSGAATRDRLLQWGIPEARLDIGGALRIAEVKAMRCDPAGLIYIALPFDKETARQMIAAARPLIAKGLNFVVKDHPMSPYLFTPEKGLQRTDKPFFEQAALRALVYAATTVGLESALAGVPTVRFRPQGKLALDILPAGIDLPVAEGDNLEQVLLAALPPAINRDRVFSPVNIEFWKRAFAHD
ncbi:MAG: hypothetical protein HQ513_07115 [Rhodospirillales bacterium]|nr:hypothetical protein [Rhodospirillales bacterium]